MVHSKPRLILASVTAELCAINDLPIIMHLFCVALFRPSSTISDRLLPYAALYKLHTATSNGYVNAYKAAYMRRRVVIPNRK
jgi:hypothetical protein